MEFGASSLTAARITTLAPSGTPIENATGFFYKVAPGEPPFLVTNWHVVTGRSPVLPSVSATGAVPTHLQVNLHRKIGDGRIVPRHTGTATIILNDPAGNTPTWFEHPTLRFRADVVAIPLQASVLAAFEFDSFGAGGMSIAASQLHPKVLDDVYVIGFPWGLTGGGPALPIYKKGTVASEPAVGQRGLPRFLIDCRTARGMSGAPVLLSRFVMGDPVLAGGEGGFGRAVNFVGIYSGRLTAEELEPETSDSASLRAEAVNAMTEIGIVWRHAVLEGIVRSRSPGTKLEDL